MEGARGDMWNRLSGAGALNVVLAERGRARRLHPVPLHSMAEGLGVLQEEVNELWEANRASKGRVTPDVRQEIAQVAAVALRMLEELSVADDAAAGGFVDDDPDGGVLEHGEASAIARLSPGVDLRLVERADGSVVVRQDSRWSGDDAPIDAPGERCLLRFELCTMADLTSAMAHVQMIEGPSVPTTPFLVGVAQMREVLGDLWRQVGAALLAAEVQT